MANSQPQIAVKQLTIVSKTQNSISLRWTKATDLETPQSKLRYTVTWCKAPYVWDNNVRKIGDRLYDQTSYTITGLSPNTTYDIYLYVRDEGGYENVYAKSTVTTLPAASTNTAPSIPNKTLTVTKINARSISLAWQKATDKETAQDKLQYLVRWSPSPFSTANCKTSGWRLNFNSYQITGLLPNTTYDIQVFVYDGKVSVSYTTRTVKTIAETTGSPSPTTDAERRKQIRDGLAAINYRPADLINNTLYYDKEVYPDAEENTIENAAYLLTVTPTIINNKEVYVRGSGYENIYPGALLIVDPDITSGNPNPFAAIARSNVSMYGDFLAGSTTKQTNITPTNMATRTAVNNIMRTLLADSRYKAPGVQRPRTTIFTSEKEMMLDFKVDASFAGVSLNAKARTESSEKSFVQATTLEQDYFTVKLADDWRQDTSSLFANNVTWKDIEAKLKGKAIAIVTSVTYGRTFSYLKEFSTKKFTYTGSQSVKGYGQSGSSEQKTAESQEYTNDDVFNLGGTALSAAVLRSKKTQAELEKAMADNIEFSASNQGVVTKYTLQLVTGATPGRVITPQYDCKYNKIGYTRCPCNVEAYVNVGPVTILAGDVKVQMDVNIFQVRNGKPVIVQTINGSSSSKAQDPWWYRFSNSRGRVYGNLSKGYFVYPNPLLRIRSRDSKVDSYRADDEKRIDVSSGKIKINLKGSVIAGKNVKIVSVEDNS